MEGFDYEELISDFATCLNLEIVYSHHPRGRNRSNNRSNLRAVVHELAAKLELPTSEVLALETSATHRPKPLVLHRLSQFYDIPQRHLAELAGAIVQVPGVVREQASRFAAQSDSFAKLSREEQRTLDEFVNFLKSVT